MNKKMLAGALAACLSSALAPAMAAAGAQCDGMPRLDVTTPAGFCVAVLADGLKFPRGVLPLTNGDILVTDMTGWAPKQGKLWLLQPKAAGGGYERKLLLDKLDRPNGIVQGPDGLVYVGEVGRIFRFDLRDPARAITDVIGGTAKTPRLPGLGLHLLTNMRFSPKGDLYVNVGSSTDHCENDGKAPDPAKACPSAEGLEALGAIREYTMAWPAGTVTSWRTHARGLRNSMALAFHPATGELWQAENARDAIQAAMPELKSDENLPHEELNLIKADRHYGWPYCYDDNVASPEYPKTACAAQYAAPQRLLPGHAAPLGMTFYTASRYPALYKNSLIIGYHGYRSNGHRLVALLPDKAGAPLGKSVELIGNWERKGKQGRGAPVDVKQGQDGDIYMADDHNGLVLKLHYEAGKP
ncbi:glucose / sorbosone dehydrogenase [Janthinobacterium sp. HH103]|uniref:PQQ-dependent sugar dehydrogenase n=2 Tax=Janthinobacterium TaxID=29580 RepID=UPI0008739D2C|nr:MULTISPECIES: PQQ-dependent sugar dehydrogenase [unclassified Janthinobacterium]OEZ80595.1 glucose / sorbosone dehydrogenase [Janthinobacterium sp. HH103]QOU74126.1 Glucose / Sorbosone dehydrogenase [Janthinobacterium sp. HH102]